MTGSPDPLHGALRDAFAAESRADRLVPPPIDELVSEREHRARRRVTLVGVGVLAIAGVGGLALASGGDSRPASPAAADGSDGFDTFWRCTGALASDGVASWFEDCTPTDEIDPVATTTIVPELVPATTTELMEEVIPTTEEAWPSTTSLDDAVPMSVDPTTTEFDETPIPTYEDGSPADAGSGPFPTVPVTTSIGANNVEVAYEMQIGDYPLLVAEMFCTDLEQLLLYNDIPMTDDGEFDPWPSVGEIVKIPPGWSTDC